MKPTRGKTMTLAMLFLGLAAVLAAGLSFKDRLKEACYLWKLESGEVGDRKAALGVLVEMRSPRAIPVLLLRTYRCHQDRIESEGPRGQWARARDVSLDAEAAKALEVILKEVGPGAVPFLVQVLRGDDPAARTLAIEALIDLGPGARSAAPALIEVLDDRDADFIPRVFSSLALRKIGPDAREATPALVRALGDGDDRVRRSAARTLEALGAGDPP